MRLSAGSGNATSRTHATAERAESIAARTRCRLRCAPALFSAYLQGAKRSTERTRCGAVEHANVGG
jgi:hypothetical protein